jgi:hypothetical protein
LAGARHVDGDGGRNLTRAFELYVEGAAGGSSDSFYNMGLLLQVRVGLARTCRMMRVLASVCVFVFVCAFALMCLR